MDLYTKEHHWYYDFKRSNVDNVGISGEIERLRNSNNVAKTFDVNNVEGVKLIKFDILYKWVILED